MRVLSLAPAFVSVMVLAGCAGAPSLGQLSGKAANDPETARRRAVFANGDTLTVAAATPFLTKGQWTCAYHATTTEIVFPAATDLSYDLSFAAAGATIAETASNIRLGGAAGAGWTGAYRFTQGGLRSDGANASELLRRLDPQTIGIEWLYAAAPGDERGDPGIGVPNLRTAGLATCTAPAQ